MNAPHLFSRLVTAGTTLLALNLFAAIEPLPYRVAAKAPDAASLASPGEVRLQGFLGERVSVNESKRLLEVDLEPLLAGYRHKPGVHPWIGEHIGKWMHAATLAWAQTGDAALRARLDYAAAELVKAQEPDGYLGTYAPDKRFGLYPGADWDVWSHKYCLIGLLTYYQFTGNTAALDACRKAADLLLATFGPGKKSILAAGTHVGMAATSVLEPIVVLYRFTGDPGYLDFAHYLVQSWDEPNGPHILQTLLTAKSVQQTANGKAYEMLSNLVGLCETYRATGEQDFLLQAVLNAWQDVVANRLYLTGSASQGEHFHGDHELPNGESAHVAETCVTTTWIQLNEQLLRLTGEARFGDELERTFYNHLAAAQSPAGSDWCYFTPLEGRKDYLKDINCCHSSGPRGMALIPPAAAFTYRAKGAEGIAVNSFELASFSTRIRGRSVELKVVTQFPREGRATVTVETAQPVRFALKFRVPTWAGTLGARLDGSAVVSLKDGWYEIAPREWKPGEQVELNYQLTPRRVTGTYGNAGKAALEWGPFVLAYDQNRNPGLPAPSMVGFADTQGGPVCQRIASADDALQFAVEVVTAQSSAPQRAIFVPFAEAGRDGGRYAVWLRAPGASFPKNASLFAFAEESRNDPGNVVGSITDGDPGTYVVTFNGRPQGEAWFEVQTDRPVRVGRVVFAHGRSFHDGGWFDASARKPRVQVKRAKDGGWEDVGEFAGYPATTTTANAGLKPGDKFALTLATPVEAFAVRVLGKPACGDNPAQAFASCGELEGFEQ